MSSAIVAGVVVAAGTAYAANRSNAAAGAQRSAANQANQLSDSQNRQARADNAPWTVTGAGAENRLARLFGLPTTTADQAMLDQTRRVGDTELPGGTITTPIGGGRYTVSNPDGSVIGTLVPGGANGRFQPNGTAIATPAFGAASAPQSSAPDLTAFTESPGYQFRRQEGTRGVVNSFGASGGAFSGNALKALADFNSGLASEEFGKYVNQLNTIAGNGQQATSENNQMGANSASIQGRNALYAGDARASGVENQANIVGEGLNQLGSIAGYYAKNRQPRSYGGTGYGSYPWMTPGYGDAVRYG